MAATMLSPGQVIEPSPAAAEEQPWRENLNIHVMCPECREDPPNIVEDFSAGDTVCASCGLVLGARIVDTRSEWRTFANDESGSDDPSRVGSAANPLLDGSQLETSISFGDGGARSRELNRAHAKISQDKATKNLKEAYARIASLAAGFRLTDNVITTAQQLYKATEEAKAFKGKNTDAVVASCLFIACRQMGVPRSFKEIHHGTNVSKKDIGRTFKALEKFLKNSRRNGVNPLDDNAQMAGLRDAYQTKTSTSPAELCGRYCNRLQTTKAVTKTSIALAEKLSSSGSLAGRSPLSTAAACIYMASHLMGDSRTPKQIAEVADVSDGTIRTAYKLLYAEKDLLIDPEWLGKDKGDMAWLPQV